MSYEAMIQTHKHTKTKTNKQKINKQKLKSSPKKEGKNVYIYKNLTFQILFEYMYFYMYLDPDSSLHYGKCFTLFCCVEWFDK